MLSELVGESIACFQSTPIYPVVLCGGGGTRLWPLSRKDLPKPFVPLVDGRSLLDLTLDRLKGLGQPLLLVTAEDLRFQAHHAVMRSDCSASIILEDAARDTTAAMTMAALAASAPTDLLLFCPADHLIPDTQAFLNTLATAVPAAKAGSIVTMGVYPTEPSSAFGYLQLGDKNQEGGHRVAKFIEKPHFEQAKTLLLNGNVLWNAGIFLGRADVLLKAVDQFAPDILMCCRQAMQLSVRDADWPFIRPNSQALSLCQSISFDKAVMERHADTVVVPFMGHWSDVGSWDSLSKLTPPDENGNRLHGQAVALSSQNTYIRAQSRLVVALGTQDLIVVESPDAVLVAASHMAQQVRQVEPHLRQLKEGDDMPSARVMRPWGWFQELHQSEGCRIKLLHIESGASLSLQSHLHRSEHWYVKSGVAHVICGDETQQLTEKESIFIDKKQVHQLSNPGLEPLQVIEIQTGNYLEEDDIVRYASSLSEIHGS